MAINYYDDAIVAKLQKWIPDNSRLRVLKPDETTEMFRLKAEDSKDQPISLPLITLSRSKDIELLLSTKNPRSYDGLRFDGNTAKTKLLNVIPIKVEYQLDIYTKTMVEADEYIRNFLFKLINNPTFVIKIPYNGSTIYHTANLRVLNTISDTSDISEHLFTGQFTRYSLHIELQDGFLFSIPYKNNWTFEFSDLEVESTSDLDASTIIEVEGLNCNS